MNFFKENPFLVAVGIVVIIAVIAVGFFLSQPDPLTKIDGLGGQAFFMNPAMQEYAKEHGYQINVITNSGADSYPQKGKEDYNSSKYHISFIQAGSINTKTELTKKFGDKNSDQPKYGLNPGELPGSNGPIKMISESIIGTSPMVLWVKDDSGYFTALKDAGFFECQGEICTISAEKTHVLVQATIEKKTWKSIGVEGIYGTVNIGFPTGGGGRATAAQLLSCWKPDENGEFCTSMVTPEQMATEEYKNAFLALYAAGGQIPAGDDSLKIGINWFPLPSSISPTVLLAATESSYVTFKNELNDSQKNALEGVKVRAIYFERPIVSTFTVICMDEDCKNFFEKAIADPEFQKIMSDGQGVRTATFTQAPTFAAPFIDPNPRFQPLGFPFPEVTSIINTYIQNWGK